MSLNFVGIFISNQINYFINFHTKKSLKKANAKFVFFDSEYR